MPEGIIIALIGLVGSLIGSLIGILASSKLVQYRLEQLEKKVQAHNNLIERMYNVEARLDLDEEKLKVANHRIDDLEKAAG
jgi:ABC-type lipoprotein release transport system permease subunit